MSCVSHKFCESRCVTRHYAPTSSEIQHSLGALLAQIFFDYGHHEAIKILDSSSHAELPQKQYGCVTQSDQSKTGMLQKQLEEPEFLKSYIHRNILALGDDVLKRFQAEVETTTQGILRNEFAKERHMLEAEKRLAVNRNVEEVHARYEEYFAFAQQELEERLRIEWADANAKHDKELQKAVVSTRLDTTRDVLRRMRPEICHVITSLHNDLELSHRATKENMIAEFNKAMRRQYAECDARIKEIERKKMEELCIQRHELEIQNATDIIYVLCMERLRNNAQIHALHKHFEEKIKSLHELVTKQDETMNVMKGRIREYESENKMFQEKIAAITKEFQKFINFAFKTVPEHADFLLPLDLPLDLSGKQEIGYEKNDIIEAKIRNQNRTDIKKLCDEI